MEAVHLVMSLLQRTVRAHVAARRGVMVVRRTATAVVIVAASLLAVAGTTSAAEVLWTAAPDAAPGLPSGFLAWGDLDGDEDDDVTSFLYGKQFWSEGCPGPPSWVPEEIVFPSVTDCSWQSGTLGDVDADGDLDLIIGCWQCCSYWMVLNVGTRYEPVFQYGGAIAGDPEAYSNGRAWLSDVDADGDLDIVACNNDRHVRLFENTGTPEAPYWVRGGIVPGVTLGDGHGELALGDLDGDGDLDLVAGVPTVTPGVQCWENIGTPQVYSFVENPAMLTGVDVAIIMVDGLALPDVDCDGDPDLLIHAYPDVYLYLNERITPVGPGSWGTIKALYR